MERWIDIKGYEGYYQVSDLGNVKRLAGSPRCKKDRILKSAYYPNGYKFVYLCKNSEPKTYLVHRLVLENFKPVENMKELQVNHLDENRANNTLINLEWCTQQENINYGNRTKKYIESRGHKIRCVETGKIYNSLREAERDTGCLHQHIAECAKGIIKQTHGLHWTYWPAGE